MAVKGKQGKPEKQTDPPGERKNWYANIQVDLFICDRCNEERPYTGQKDNLCLTCRWELREEGFIQRVEPRR